MRVSIALASYKGASYIRQQLESFVVQTHQPDELIVCDDASGDETVAIVNSFARTAPFPVKIYTNEMTLGYSRNFERAISLCTEDIIFLSDQDDQWEPSKIEAVLGVFEAETETYLVVNDMRIADEELRPSFRTQLGNIISSGGREENFYSGCCMAIRRPLLELLLPFPVQYFAHDNWINHVALALNVRTLLRTPLQLYRRHGENASNWALSSPDGITQLGLLRLTGLSSSVEGWANQLERYEAVRIRIQERGEVIERFGLLERRDSSLIRLKSREANLSRRLMLVSKPRWVRLLGIILFWLKGGYKDFSGWKSAVKDMIRP